MDYTKLRFHALLTVNSVILSLLLVLSACSDTDGPVANSAATVQVAPAESGVGAGVGLNVVHVMTEHDHDSNEHTFSLNTNKVPQGWTRFHFTNATHLDHFFLLYKVPQEAVDAAEAANQPVLDHWYHTVTAPFQAEWNPYFAGDIGFGQFVNNLFAAVLGSAPWFPNAVTMGGPGITSAGHISETTIHLAEGIYIAECYVKDEHGEFHSYNGMLEMIEVTAEPSGEPEPQSTFAVTISQNGIEHPESVRPGKHTIGIHFGEQPAFGYEHLLGHNLQLMRLEEGYDQDLLDDVGAWIDWSVPEGLMDTAPAGATFIGGSMEMQGGNTAYFTVNLKPGHYAWIAEVPDPDEKKMLKTFSVPFGRDVK